jgi:signal transduction histidine kinase
VSDASHELKSPIAALRAHLEVDLAHPDQADWLQTERAALTEVTALQRLVEDLLTLARLPGGTRPLRHETVDVDDLVLREAERIRTRDRVRVDLSKVSAGQVEGDPAQLARAVRNLLDNAERHAASTIGLSVQEQNGTVRVDVADDGPGIPPDDRQRIFERFARLDDARTPHTAGTGLGLALAREIVQHHGGTLAVEDNRPGARFIVRLPVAPSGTA